MPFASTAVLSLRNALGVPSAKIPVDGTTFVSYVLPPLVCYFAVAVLAVTPRTRIIRVAFWPLVALLALRAALSVDMSFGKPEQEFNSANLVVSVFLTHARMAELHRSFLQFLMLAIAARTLDWTLAKGPLVRHLRPANSSPSTIMDALDLVSNFRGIGWDWSGYRLYTPRDTRPTNRIAFAIYTFLSALAHALISGACHRAVLTVVPVGNESTPGASTIFDETLPLFPRYFRASVISVFATFMIYSVMQMAYDLITMSAILLLGQDPAQWPPAFDAPWRATSLSEFWGRRWHQFFRHIFLLLGGRPLSLVFGRPGTIIGTFLGSVFWHHIRTMALSSRADIRWMLFGFGMMAPGILIERAFHQLTGRRVGGVIGWVWTMTWLILWGNVIIEGFAREGMFISSSPIDSASPLRPLVERLAIDFDSWLHTI